MAVGAAVAGGARGGEDVQAPRPRHARVATAAAALVVAAAVGISGVLRDPSHEALLVAVAAAALVVLALGLAVRWSAALGVGVAMLGAQQAVRLALGHESLDPWTPAVAGALLLAAELAWWSIEPRVPAAAEAGMAAARFVTIVLVCVGATVVSGLVVLASGSSVSGGFELELLGVASAAAALALLAYVARRRATAAD